MDHDGGIENSLALTSRNLVERETGRKRTAELTQALDGRFPIAVETNLELPRARYRHFNLVAFL
jgi:hypothetical protein